MAEDILIKDLPKAAFETRMTGELTKFLQDQADYFAQHPDEKNELTNSMASTIDDMYHVLHQEPISNQVGRGEGTQIVWLGADVDPVQRIMAKRGPTAAGGPSADCIAAIITCAVDGLAIVFQAIGAGMVARQLARTLIAGLELPGIIGLDVAVNALNAAATAFQKAVAVAKLGGAILRLIGFKQLIQALKDNLRWYQWVIMGVIIVAQIVAWFATDGIALAAEIVIFAGLVAALVADAVHAAQVCQLPHLAPT